jgi:ELP3 family radical SAM enzyme/protein acetyltransferase
MAYNPESFKRSKPENVVYNNDIEDIVSRPYHSMSDSELSIIKDLVRVCIENGVSNEKMLNKTYEKFRKDNKLVFRKNKLLHALLSMLDSKEIENTDNIKILKECLVKKSGKSTSGVLVITVLTSPYPNGQKFSCKHNCYFCPDEPDQPRSYLHDEPSVIRANRNHFDPVLQFYDRATTLMMNGHPVDKIELLVLGGTWSSYPYEYQEAFIRDIFYAANTFYSDVKREKLKLSDEKTINETSQCKIIGITLETRPDEITIEEIRRFRYFGCTRVQLGVQHNNNNILKKINRGHTIEDTKRALKLLKDNGYKIDIHLMPNLPFSSPELDMDMFNTVLYDPDLQADQWKIYPCEVVPWTVIEKWYKSGKYTPYSEDNLNKVIVDVKSKIHPWIRLNRIVRDIPSQYILGGNVSSMRDTFKAILESQGKVCNCIRCREIKSDIPDSYNLIIRKYFAQNGTEYFISYETSDNKILGFCRLRINNDQSFFSEIKNAAFVRELHVYGQLKTKSTASNTQHTGFGTKLMLEAEKIAKNYKVKNIAVISGVGVRGYYRKLGYTLDPDSEFMVKNIYYFDWSYYVIAISIVISIGISVIGIFSNVY